MNSNPSEPLSARRLRLCAVVFACVVTAAAVATSATALQSKAISVGVLAFHNESGVNAPPELGKRLAQQLRQRLNTSYKDVVARAIDTGANSSGTVSVEQMMALAKQSGVKVIVRAGILALDSETAADETRISVQLFADLISADTGTVNTVRVEGTGQQKGASGALRINAETLASSDFSTSALGLALSNAVEQLTSLVYQSMTGQGSRRTPVNDAEAQSSSNPTPDPQQDAAVSADEELKQLIAQAESLLANPAAIKSDSATSLDRAVRALKDALASKAALLEKAMDTSEADLQVAARKDELQTVLTAIMTEAASAGGATEAQPSGQKKNALAKISEYLGESTNLLQKIQEFRAAFRSANEDPSQYAGELTTPSGESAPFTEETTAGIEGVVTESGSPVEGVTVTDVESGASATTDSTGSYSLTGVLGGKLAKLILEKNGKQIGSGQLDVPRGRSGVADFEVTPNSNASAVRVLPASAFINALKARPGSSTGELRGVVEDFQGKPVARALVQLKNLGVARTDSQGRYAFYKVPAGVHQLTIQSAGQTAKSEQVQVPAAGSTERRFKLASPISPQLREALILPGAGTSLRGVVRDTDNRFIEGAKVTLLQGTQALAAVTGAQGSVSLRDLKPGSYRVVISKAGFESWSQTITLRAGQVEQREVRLRKMTGTISSLIDLQRAQRGEIRGQVRWSSGEPASGAAVEITLVGRPYPVVKTIAGSRGEYSVKLAEGRYEIKVRQGTQAISKLVTVRAVSSSTEDFTLRRLDVANVIRPLPGLTANNRTTSAAQQTGSISGQVIHVNGGTPLPGAVVSIESRAVRRSVKTDQHGSYLLEGLPPDRYRVSVSLASFIRDEKEVIARAGASTRQDFALKPETRTDGRTSIGGTRLPGLVAPTKRGQISGRVIDSRTGQPIVGAMVVVSGQRPIVTDPQGAFLTSNLEPGNYRIAVTMRGYTSVEGSVIVRSGETAVANFRLVLNPVPPVRRLRSAMNPETVTGASNENTDPRSLA